MGLAVRNARHEQPDSLTGGIFGIDDGHDLTFEHDSNTVR